MSVRSFMMLLDVDAVIVLRSGLRQHLSPKGRPTVISSVFGFQPRIPKMLSESSRNVFVSSDLSASNFSIPSFEPCTVGDCGKNRPAGGCSVSGLHPGAQAAQQSFDGRHAVYPGGTRCEWRYARILKSVRCRVTRSPER